MAFTRSGRTLPLYLIYTQTVGAAHGGTDFFKKLSPSAGELYRLMVTNRGMDELTDFLAGQ